MHSLVSSSPFLAACLHPNGMGRSSKKTKEGREDLCVDKCCHSQAVVFFVHAIPQLAGVTLPATPAPLSLYRGGGGPSATWGRTVPHLLFSFESLSPYLPIIHLTILCNDMQDLNLNRFNVPLCTFSHNAGNEANADCSSSLHSLSLTESSVH